MDRLPSRPVVVLALLLGTAGQTAAVADSEPGAPGPVIGAALLGPLRDVEDVVFAVRRPAPYHYYENFGHYLFPGSGIPCRRRASQSLVHGSSAMEDGSAGSTSAAGK
jgi:hypothetical protein